jgi:DNA repair exonuclease SbcCD nuclease subunit
MERVTVAHVADTHLGKRHYNSDLRRDDYTEAFNEVVERVIEMKDEIDVLVHGGDLFDSPNPNVNSVNECIEIFSKLEEHDIKVFGIVGNHERKREDQWIDIIDNFENVERLTKDSVDINGVSLYGIDAIRKPSWDSADLSIDGDDDKFNILFMHELVEPPVPGHMADYEAEEILDRVGLDIDILALGDYHENVSDRLNGTFINYPGSTEKTSRSESENHSFSLYKIEDNEFTHEHVNIDSPRRFIEVEFDLDTNKGITYIREQINSYDTTDNPVMVIKLEGDDAGFSKKNVEKAAEDIGAGLVKVIDNRGLPAETNGEIEDFNPNEIEKELDNVITDIDASDETRNIEDIIRDDEIANTNIREKVSNIMEGDNDEN